MRRWITLLEDVYSQEQMVRMASFWEGVTVTNDDCLVKAADYVWEHHPQFPVSAFDVMTHEEWCAWMSQEIDMWTEDGDPARFTNLLTDPVIREEVVASYGHDGKLHIWDGYHRVGASHMVGRATVPAIIGKPKLKEEYDFDYEGHADDVDPEYEQEFKPGRVPATPENIHLAKQFVMQKWAERWAEKGFEGQPADLSNSCKFSSLFAREIFGGRLRGQQAHQFVELEDGTIVDLNLDAKDVKALGQHAHFHDDELFWGNPEHKDALDSCRPRVNQWVEEFTGQTT